MARFSASGKRIGRPPKVQQPAPPTEEARAIALGRALIHMQNRYDAAGRGRRMAGWNPPSQGPNSALDGLQLIRDRARDAGSNDWSGESAVQKWSTQLIGIGITPRFRRIKSKTRKQAINDLWTDFVQWADADCVLNLYGLQTLAVRTWLEGGEAFIRRRPRFTDEGLPVPMQIQVLEGDMCPLIDADDSYDPRMGRGNILRSGIELNRRGRRVAYWFYINHPGDIVNNTVASGNQLVRVLADDVAHVFEPKRPGQMRGVSMLAPVLARLRNIADYEDATLERQKIANLWVGFITRETPALDPSMADYDPLTGLPAEMDGNNALIPLKPGLLQELGDGESVQFANPPEAGTNYSDYMRTSHLGTAAAAGLPYELMSGDIKEISDRTLRVLINDLRRFAEQRQWQIVIPQMCQRVVEWFAQAAVLNGDIGVDEADDVRRCEHAPHGWAYIHPVQDVQGKRMEVEAGFRSRSSVIGERGDDPETVDEERAVDQEREELLGLPTNGVPAVDPLEETAGDTDGIDNEEYSAPPTPTAMERAQLARLEAETEALRARARASAAPKAVEPDPDAALRNALLERAIDLLGPSGEHQ